MTARRNRRAWFFAAGSAVIHAAVILLLSRARIETAKPARTEIELSIISEPDKRAPEPEASPAAVEATPSAPIATIAPPPPTPQKRKRSTEEPPAVATIQPTPAATESKSSEAVEVPPEQPNDSQPSAAARPTWVPKKFNLSAQRAASSMIDSLEMPPRQCNPHAGSNDAAACPPAERAARIERELNLGLSQAANAPAYRQKREPPELHRQGDGSYRYDGKVFAAKIRDDGHVEFYDAGAGIDGPAKSGPGIAGHLDLNDLADSMMGKELYAAEKRWFLEQTVELRDKLAGQARTRENLQAKRLLENELERIVAARENPQHKRERILELWEDCGDDAESADTRRIVELFVRTKMPEGSELGFTREELERFNRGRTGIRAFNPYRT